MKTNKRSVLCGLRVNVILLRKLSCDMLTQGVSLVGMGGFETNHDITHLFCLPLPKERNLYIANYKLLGRFQTAAQIKLDLIFMFPAMN